MRLVSNKLYATAVSPQYHFVTVYPEGVRRMLNLRIRIGVCHPGVRIIVRGIVIGINPGIIGVKKGYTSL